MPLQIPSVRLYNITSSLLDIARKDTENPIVEDQFIFQLFDGIVVGDYIYYDEIRHIISLSKGNERRLEVRQFFDMDRLAIPTIHITLPGEQSGAADGIGMDEGIASPLWKDNDREYTPVLERTFTTQQRIIITSDNANEVVVIYELLKALFISIFPSIDIMGLENPKLSGQDLMIKDQHVPKGIFMRALTLSTMSTYNVPSQFSQKIVTQLRAIGTAVDPIK